MLKPFLAIGNAIVRSLLRSRFHWLLSGNVVLLEVTGRKSGKVYLVPVNYRTTLDGISVMTYRRRLWWRNLRHVTELPIYYQGDRLNVVPELVTDDLGAIATGLQERGWVRRSTIRARAKDSVLIKLRFEDDAAEDGVER